jgi:hypothetical protein
MSIASHRDPGDRLQHGILIADHYRSDEPKRKARSCVSASAGSCAQVANIEAAGLPERYAWHFCEHKLREFFAI